MMIPSIGTPVGFKDMISGLFSVRSLEDFGRTIASQMGRKHLQFTNSGTTAYYLILKAFQSLSDKKEVILPAYTAPSLILPIKKAGLVPRLCDINLKTFNMDLAALHKVITADTLAITIVHMFGLPLWFENPSKVKEICRGAFLVEDLASAQGSTLYGRTAGSFGDASFVSFNRGKNFSTLSGGAVATDRDDIYRLVMNEGIHYLQKPSLSTRIGLFFKTAALSLAVRPWFYTIFRNFISQFKYQGLHDTFAIHAYSRFQAGVGNSAFRRSQFIFDKRFQNGLYLHRALSLVKGIKIPAIPNGAIPAFNQFPIVIDDLVKRDRIFNALLEEGLEATRLYPQTIHEVYDLGYDIKKDPFPNATYLAKRLILIPSHPYVKEKNLKKSVDTILRLL